MTEVYNISSGMIVELDGTQEEQAEGDECMNQFSSLCTYTKYKYEFNGIECYEVNRNVASYFKAVSSRVVGSSIVGLLLLGIFIYLWPTVIKPRVEFLYIRATRVVYKPDFDPRGTLFPGQRFRGDSDDDGIALPDLSNINLDHMDHAKGEHEKDGVVRDSDIVGDVNPMHPGGYQSNGFDEHQGIGRGGGMGTDEPAPVIGRIGRSSSVDSNNSGGQPFDRQLSGDQYMGRPQAQTRRSRGFSTSMRSGGGSSRRASTIDNRIGKHLPRWMERLVRDGALSQQAATDLLELMEQSELSFTDLEASSHDPVYLDMVLKDSGVRVVGRRAKIINALRRDVEAREIQALQGQVHSRQSSLTGIGGSGLGSNGVGDTRMRAGSVPANQRGSVPVNQLLLRSISLNDTASSPRIPSPASHAGQGQGQGQGQGLVSTETAGSSSPTSSPGPLPTRSMGEPAVRRKLSKRSSSTTDDVIEEDGEEEDTGEDTAGAEKAAPAAPRPSGGGARNSRGAGPPRVSFGV